MRSHGETWEEYDARARAVCQSHPEVNPRTALPRIRSSYSMDIYEIADEALLALPDFELAALATEGRIPWGYTVDRDRLRITIATD